MEWKCKQFSDLSPDELYAILRLRSEVFVVEQNCVFLDMDNRDQASFHLTGWKNNNLVAYTRLVPPGIIYDEPSIGRVVTSHSERRTGAGRELMEISIQKVKELFGARTIRIGAQVYLKNFYESFGFIETGSVYMEDGIQHIEMIVPILEN